MCPRLVESSDVRRGQRTRFSVDCSYQLSYPAATIMKHALSRSRVTMQNYAEGARDYQLRIAEDLDCGKKKRVSQPLSRIRYPVPEILLVPRSAAKDSWQYLADAGTLSARFRWRRISPGAA